MVLVLLGIFLILFLAKISGVSLSNIIRDIQNVEYPYLIALVLSFLILIMLTGWKWEALLKDITDIRSFTRGYFIYYSAIGVVSNNIIPYVGNFGVKVSSMKLLYEVPITTGIFTVFIEQLFDLLVLVLVVLPSCLFFFNIITVKCSVLLNFIVAIFAGILLVIYHVRLVEIIITGYIYLCKIITRIPLIGTRFKITYVPAHKVLQISKSAATKLYFYSYMKFIVVVFRFYIIAVLLNLNISFYVFIVAVPAVLLIVLWGPIPGNLGISETGWFAILTIFDINTSDIGTFMIVNRIFGEAALLLAALIAYCYYTINRLFGTVEER